MGREPQTEVKAGSPRPKRGPEAPDRSVGPGAPDRSEGRDPQTEAKAGTPLRNNESAKAMSHKHMIKRNVDSDALVKEVSNWMRGGPPEE